MRRLHICFGIIVSALLMLVTGAQAQRPIFKAEAGKTFYAGISADPTGYFGSEKGGMISFDSKNPYAEPLNHIVKQSDMIIAGAMATDEEAGNKYYAMCGNAAGAPTDFCTIDFVTGTKKILGAATKLTSMTYDPTGKVMYGIQQVGEKTKFYTIDLKNGTLTEKAEFDAKLVAICMGSYNILSGITSDRNYCTLFPNETPARVNKRGILGNNGAATPAITLDGSGQSLVYDSETKTTYWLACGVLAGSQTPICFLSTINTTAVEYSKIGTKELNFGQGKVQLTGLSVSATTGTVMPSDPVNIVYAAIAEDIMGSYGGGGIMSFDRTNPYDKLTKAYPLSEIVSAGAEAEGKYYAMRENYSEGSKLTDFCTIDMETGEATRLGAASRLFGMTYDVKNKVMYGLEQEDAGSTIHSINLVDGKLTEVAKFDGLYGIAIAANAEGALYMLTDDKNLQLLNLTEQTATPVMSITIAPDGYSQQSLAFNNGVLYWLGYGEIGKGAPSCFLATIDLTAKTTTLVGSGEFKNVRLTGLYFPKVSKKTTKMKTIKTYGDILGTPKTVCTRVETFYYDADNKIERSSLRGYRVDDATVLDPMKYTTYKYNDKKQLVESSYRQYGQYDGIYAVYGAPKGKLTYEYNTSGKLVKFSEIDDLNYYLYEWDGDNKTKEIKMHLRYNTTDDWYALYTTSFSNFLEGTTNCPQRIDSEGDLESYKFYGIYTYDSNHNKTLYTTFNLDDSPKGKEEWKYDANGILTESLKYKLENDQFVVASKTVYTTTGNDTKIDIEGNSTCQVQTIAEFDGETAPLNLTIENVSTETTPNMFKLTCDVPQSSTIANPAWDIYRDGMPIARITSLTEGKIVYTDKDVFNGMHDYFVQTVENLENGQTYNISNGVTLENVSTELLPATNVRYVSHEKASTYIVTIAWDAPQSKVPVIGYNIYLGISKMPEFSEIGDKGNLITTPITETEVAVDFGPAESSINEQKDVVIETIYSIGRIKTEKINVKIILDSIKENELQSMIKFNGNELTVNGEYTLLDIYNANGILVKTAKGLSNIDLSSLPSGIYMIQVNQDGKTSTLKIAKK